MNTRYTTNVCVYVFLTISDTEVKFLVPKYQRNVSPAFSNRRRKRESIMWIRIGDRGTVAFSSFHIFSPNYHYICGKSSIVNGFLFYGFTYFYFKKNFEPKLWFHSWFFFKNSSYFYTKLFCIEIYMLSASPPSSPHYIQNICITRNV